MRAETAISDLHPCGMHAPAVLQRSVCVAAHMLHRSACRRVAGTFMWRPHVTSGV
jgi:hypothetical protein